MRVRYQGQGQLQHGSTTLTPGEVYEIPADVVERYHGQFVPADDQVVREFPDHVVWSDPRAREKFIDGPPPAPAVGQKPPQRKPRKTKTKTRTRR